MGRDGYDTAGFHLAKLVASIGPDDMTADDWAELVEHFAHMVIHDRRAEALDWLDRWLPRCMSLVPERHRLDFIMGFDRAAYEFDITDP